MTETTIGDSLRLDLFPAPSSGTDDKSKPVSDDDDRIEGHTVELLEDGKVVETVKTDANGFYKFDKLDAGYYEIRVKSPDGGELSFSDASATVQLGEEDKNKDWGFTKPDPAPEESPDSSPNDEPTASEPSPRESPEPSTGEEPPPLRATSRLQKLLLARLQQSQNQNFVRLQNPQKAPRELLSQQRELSRLLLLLYTPPAVNHTLPAKQPVPNNPSRVNTPPFVPDPAQPAAFQDQFPNMVQW